MSFGVKQLELSNFIFHFLVVVLGHVNLILQDSARAYEFCTTNDSYRTGGNNAKTYTLSHYLAPWSYFEKC